MPTFALNFSRPGSQVAAQYYMFLRLGREGYRAVQQASRDIAMGLATGLAELGPFSLLTRGDQLPVFALTTTPDAGFDVFAASRLLRERGWLVPAYTFPQNRTDLSVLRVVIRNGFSEDLAGLLLDDVQRLLPEMRRVGRTGGAGQPPRTVAFHH
jgi:glutamate decarboxylase